MVAELLLSSFTAASIYQASVVLLLVTPGMPKPCSGISSPWGKQPPPTLVTLVFAILSLVWSSACQLLLSS